MASVFEKLRLSRYPLLPLRASYFVLYFGLAAILPFLPVFLKTIGLDAEQAGIISGARPLVQFICLPLWGFVADKTQRYRAVLLTVLIASTLIIFSAPWLPNAVSKPDLITSSNSSSTANLTDQVLCNRSTTNDPDCPTDNSALFYVMLAVFCLGACFDGSIPSFIDTAVVARIRQVATGNVNFGSIRLFGSIGFGISSAATGLAVQLSNAEEPDYSMAFYIFLASNTVLVLISLSLFKGIKAAGSQPKVLGVVLKQLIQPEVIFYFCTICVMGLANGVLYGFLFWFLSELGGSEILMGLSILVSCFSELFIFPFSYQLTNLIGGNMAAISLAVLSYGVRFILMSYLINPWLILPIQLLHSIGFALFWSAAIYQISIYSTNATQATMVAILNGVHFGISTGLASMFGGVLYKKYGGRQLYLYSGITCCAWFVLVLLVVLRDYCRRKNDPEYEKNNEENQQLTSLKQGSPEQLANCDTCFLSTV